MIPKYILVLFLLILIDYSAGIIIEKSIGSTRKFYLIVSLLANLGLLSIFKYYNFFGENISNAISLLFGHDVRIPRSNLILPIGLSFHTFQSMSYTIEVYFKRVKAERHLGIYALYVLYFPQMVAGPIERPQNILPQLHNRQWFSIENATSGLRLILLGLVKKVLVADNLARVVDAIYTHPQGQSGFALLIATYFFAIQIYCDFSGYSDIARGSSQFFGINLMQNFNSPYFARSINDFWGRWHISLSTWFRDYLYIPLGGNRVSKFRHSANLMLVFLVSGLWHGANWTYVIWGALHGSYLVMALQFKRFFGRFSFNETPIVIFLNWLITFHLVSFAWIFFRANSVNDATYIIRRIFTNSCKLQYESSISADESGGPEQLKFYLALAFLFLIFDFATRSSIVTQLWFRAPAPFRWTGYVCAILAIVIGGRFAATQFIYFQF